MMVADGNHDPDEYGLPAIEAAFARRDYQWAWELAWALEPELETAGRWSELIESQQLALAAAVRLDDWLLQGHSHLLLARASLALGNHRRARQQLAESTYILTAVRGRTPAPR
jgi:hypothetical protein